MGFSPRLTWAILTCMAVTTAGQDLADKTSTSEPWELWVKLPDDEMKCVAAWKIKTNGKIWYNVTLSDSDGFCSPFDLVAPKGIKGGQHIMRLCESTLKNGKKGNWCGTDVLAYNEGKWEIAKMDKGLNNKDQLFWQRSGPWCLRRDQTKCFSIQEWTWKAAPPMATQKPSSGQTRRRSGRRRRRKGGKGGRRRRRRRRRRRKKPKTTMAPTPAPTTTPEPTTTTMYVARRRRSRRRAPPRRRTGGGGGGGGQQYQCSVCGYGPVSAAQYNSMQSCPRCGQPVKSVYQPV